MGVKITIEHEGHPPQVIENVAAYVLCGVSVFEADGQSAAVPFDYVVPPLSPMASCKLIGQLSTMQELLRLPKRQNAPQIVPGAAVPNGFPRLRT